jgi:hypothetical protein
VSVRGVKITWLPNSTRAKKLSGSRVVPVGFLDTYAWRRGFVLEDMEFEYRQRQDISSSPKHPDYLWDPISIQFNDYFGFSSRVIRPELDVVPSLPSNAEAKNKWINTSVPWTGVA